MPCDEYDGVEEYLDEHAAWCVGGSMNRFMKYLNEIGAQYVMNDRTTAESEKIPEPLRGFYNTFQSADLPYGRIYDLDTALRQSGKSPFSRTGLYSDRTIISVSGSAQKEKQTKGSILHTGIMSQDWK